MHACAAVKVYSWLGSGIGLEQDKQTWSKCSVLKKECRVIERDKGEMFLCTSMKGVSALQREFSFCTDSQN